MKKILILCSCFLLAFCGSQAQELNCRVTVIAPQISNVEKSIFDMMEESIQDFLNGRKWTNDFFELEERIECNLQITISEAVGQTQFRGSFQVQSSRPVYNADYKTPVLLVNDKDIDFTFLQNTLLQFSLAENRDNLSSLLAYYAYMVIGLDYDTFALEGGTEMLLNCQTIVANAQNSASPGWKASEGQQNRYWLIENLMSQTFKPLRKCLYEYHRLGFDKLYSNLEDGRKTIGDCLIGLRSIHKIRPASYNLQVFFMGKADEIVNLFSPDDVADEEKIRLYNLLTSVDPGNITKYDKMMN